MNPRRPMDDDATLDAAIVTAAEAEAAELAGHPSPEELLAYHVRALAAEERDRVQEHLALCPECARLVLDFEAFPSPGEEAAEEPPLPAAVLEEDWRRLTASLAPAAGVRRQAPGRMARTASRALRRAQALAAVFFVATAGLALWVVRLYPGGGAEVPRVGVYVESLSPRGEDTVRGGPEEIALPAWAQRLVLRLELGDSRLWERYQVVLLDRGSEEIWSHPDIPRDPDGRFSVEIPRGFLPPGRYDLRLTGVRGGEVVELGSYGFRVVEP